MNSVSNPPPATVHVEQPQQPYDDDEHSGEIREYSGVFEGPEKTLGTQSFVHIYYSLSEF